MIAIREIDDHEVFIWSAEDQWFWGFNMENGPHGPFVSFDACIEDWRQDYSRRRGRRRMSRAEQKIEIREL